MLESLQDEVAVVRTTVHKHGALMRQLQDSYVARPRLNAGARSTRLLANEDHDVQRGKQREQPLQVWEPTLNIGSPRTPDTDTIFAPDVPWHDIPGNRPTTINAGSLTDSLALASTHSPSPNDSSLAVSFHRVLRYL